MGSERFESRGLGDKGQLVEQIKLAAGVLDDLYKECRSGISNDEVARLTSLAVTHLEISVMCAVKAISRRAPEKRA